MTSSPELVVIHYMDSTSCGDQARDRDNNHIYESVCEERSNLYQVRMWRGPGKWTYQNQNKPSCIVTKDRGILDAQDPEDVAKCLCESRENDDPAVWFL